MQFVSPVTFDLMQIRRHRQGTSVSPHERALMAACVLHSSYQLLVIQVYSSESLMSYQEHDMIMYLIIRTCAGKVQSWMFATLNQDFTVHLMS